MGSTPNLGTVLTQNYKIMTFWITTDELGTWLHEEKPVIDTFHGIKYFQSDKKRYMLSRELFPELSFKNSPQKVEVTLIKETPDNSMYLKNLLRKY